MTSHSARAVETRDGRAARSLSSMVAWKREKVWWAHPFGPWMMLTASRTWVVTESAPVRVQPPDLDVGAGKGLKVIDLERGWDSQARVLHDPGCKRTVAGRLGTSRFVLDDGLPVQLGELHHPVAGDEFHQHTVHPPGKLGDQVLLLRLALGIADDAGKAALALCPGCQPLYGLADVVCRIERHQFTGRDKVDLLRIPFPHGHGKAAADNVAQHIVDDD